MCATHETSDDPKPQNPRQKQPKRDIARDLLDAVSNAVGHEKDNDTAHCRACQRMGPVVGGIGLVFAADVRRGMTANPKAM